ncbi:hypothetical protein ACTXT7_006443 [Hymenolepis weldensis]
MAQHPYTQTTACQTALWMLLSFLQSYLYPLRSSNIALIHLNNRASEPGMVIAPH